MSRSWSSVKYSALPQQEDEIVLVDEQQSAMEFGMPAGTFQSAFTYANYNDLDKMGYQAPKRFGNQLGNKYSAFTYTHKFEEDDLEVAPMSAIELILYGFSVLLAVFTFPLSLLFVLKFVGNNEKLVIMRLGRAQKPRGPGATFVLPCIDSIQSLSTSVTAFNIPPLQIITTDRGLVELGATVFLKIRDPLSAVCGIQERNNSTRTLANTMLYRYISKKRVCELTNPQDRRIIAANFKDELASFTGHYGIEITNVEFSELKVQKEGENMGMAALSAVANSETGQQIWNVISPHIDDFASFTAEHSKDVESNQPSCSTENVPESSQKQSGIDIDRLLTAINMAIDEPLTRSINRVFLIECDGIEPILIDLKHLPGHAMKGFPQVPVDVTFRTTAAIFMEIIQQKTSPISAYMNGSLKISGQIQDALLLRHLAERVATIL